MTNYDCPRQFDLRQNVLIVGQEPKRAIIWGYEYSDGENPCGTPRTKYKGWFYNVRLEGTEKEFILPEDKLQRVLPNA